MSTLHQNAVRIIEQLDVSDQNTLCCAELAEQHAVCGLKNLKQANLARLHLLCYARQRFLKINDHLIASLIHKVSSCSEDTDLYQKDEIYQSQS